MTRSGIVVAIFMLAAIFGLPYLGEERREAGFVLPVSPPPSVKRPPLENRPLLVKLPEQLSLAAKAGQVLFAENCQPCHGANAGGTDSGPPLVHKLYEPETRTDFSIYRAVKFGVRSQNWKFGDMPAINGVSDQEIEMIISFVRAMQKANGIY